MAWLAAGFGIAAYSSADGVSELQSCEDCVQSFHQGRGTRQARIRPMLVYELREADAAPPHTAMATNLSPGRAHGMTAPVRATTQKCVSAIETSRPAK